MANFVIRSTRALEALKAQKKLKLYDTICATQNPGDQNNYYQVYKDDEANLYLFDSKIERDERLSAQASKPKSSCISPYNKNSLEGRRDSVSLAIYNLLRSVADQKDVDNKVLQARYPQERLKAFLAKTIKDEAELQEEFMKELTALTTAETQKFECCVAEKEIIEKVLANDQIRTNPADANLKEAFEARLTKIELAEKARNEEENESSAS